MIIEIACVVSIIAFVTLLIKERDLRYIIIFILAFLVALWVEPQGIVKNAWKYQNIMKPFDYLIFGVPICIYLLYAFPAAMIVFLNKCIIKLRERYKDKLDRIVGYVSIAIGIIFLVLMSIFGTHINIGLTFIMVGLYLIVKNPVIFYIGILGLVGDFIFEHLFILNKQMSYAISYGNICISWFLGAVIFSAIILLIDKKLSMLKKPRK